MRRAMRLSEEARGHVDKEPALALDTGGRLWVTWQSYRSKAERILARAVEGQAAGLLLEVSEGAGINCKPAIACDGENTLWVVWSAMRNGGWQILGRRLVDGRLQPLTHLSASSSVEYWPQVAADRAGQVWTAWVSVRDGRHQVLGRVLVDGEWSDIIPLSEGPGEHVRPVLCAEAVGVWLAYETYSEAARMLFLRRWGPSELTPATRFDLTDSWEMHPRLCRDGEGGVWATWIATRDVQDDRGIVDHKVEVMAARFDGSAWVPYRGPDVTKPDGYMTHLYDGLLGRRAYWGFLGNRRCPQIVRESTGDVWVLYERKQDEMVNRHGPDALFYGKPLVGSGRRQTFEIDQEAYAYVVQSDSPVESGRLCFAGQIPSGEYYGDICAGTLELERSRPVHPGPASDWRSWLPVELAGAELPPRRPTMQLGGDSYQLYWGDTHCHSSCSGDAEGEIDEVYSFGRYRAGLDFMAVTDNDFIYDDALTPSSWAFLRAEASHWNEPGAFVAFSGYERTYRDPTGAQPGQNHRTVLYPGDTGPLYRFTEPDADTLEKFVARMEDTDAFIYAHHATWHLAPSSRLGGVEVCSSWDVYIHIADAIPRALTEGRRLAFIGSSDSHRIVPGLGGALTGVWAKDLSRDAIMEALWARRCFATNGERIVLDVRAEGSPMGSQVKAVEKVTLTCTVSAPRPVCRVDLLRDGECVQTRTGNEVEMALEWMDRPGQGVHFYTIQVQLEPLPRKPMRGRGGNLQVARGDYAWSSPIWVSVGE